MAGKSITAGCDKRKTRNEVRAELRLGR